MESPDTRNSAAWATSTPLVNDSMLEDAIRLTHRVQYLDEEWD